MRKKDDSVNSYADTYSQDARKIVFGPDGESVYILTESQPVAHKGYSLKEYD